MIVPLSEIRKGFWAYIFVFWAVLIVFQFYAPSANTFAYSYTLNPVGQLTSQRWTVPFFISGMYVLLWTVPITMAFLLADPKQFARQVFHLVIVAVLGVLLLLAFISNIVDLVRANTQTANFNPANDNRWCCVFPSEPSCETNLGCPGVTAADLSTNGTFHWQMWFGFVFFLTLIIDLILLLTIIMPSFDKFRQKKSSDLESGTMEQEDNLNEDDAENDNADDDNVDADDDVQSSASDSVGAMLGAPLIVKHPRIGRRIAYRHKI